MKWIRGTVELDNFNQFIYVDILKKFYVASDEVLLYQQVK